MKKPEGGLGFVIVVIALVIVMLLAARAWNNMLPVAAQVLKPGAPGAIPDHGQTGAAEAIRSGGLPNLQQMNTNTDQHLKEMKEGTKQQD